jgi:predicted metallo-beta-lactamase superfamily hydrolase
MLNKIKVIPLAAESFGVRSMCTFVETPDVKVLLDAGISLCPNRFNLPPHPLEFQTINRLRKTIAEAANEAEAITISHYHFDHHTPSFEDWLVNWTEKEETAKQIYMDKRILLKNPRENINSTQRQRAWLFQQTSGKCTRTMEPADGKTFSFGKTHLRFSEAVTHGPENAMLGWVIMLEIKYEDESFVFAPDVQGPMSNQALNWIKTAKPNVAMIGGPPFYLSSYRVEEAQLQQAVNNLASLAEIVSTIILEHHALRDDTWQQKIVKICGAANESGNNVKTAAEFARLANNFLESKRKRLYEEMPPSKEFEKWMKESAGSQAVKKPPI